VSLGGVFVKRVGGYRNRWALWFVNVRHATALRQLFAINLA